MKKLLLHVCCAPCLIHPFEVLHEEGFSVSGLFYNPNIHPFNEYNFRRQAIADLGLDIEVDYPEYKPQEFFQAVNAKEENPGRCVICWELRLRKTANTAKEKGYTHFTTTLLVSPYQDQELLESIGSSVAKAEGVEFCYRDFRSGFRKAHDEARAKGIYCQKYCGCLYSEIERSKSKK
ncbi:MAG: epoxyqueuosine reductase QueH [Candidatus Omnitrophica bacterium]|nr:epoxyqueuosine reductase QueH [Candidatus Omnitrophota bacterium]